MLKKSLASEEEVQNHVADHYVEKRYKGLGLKYHTAIIREVMANVYGKTLDVGCGVGLLGDLYPERDIVGIDISPGMLLHHRGNHRLASANDVPFPDNSFDSVVCRSVLHHLHEPKKALSEIKRVLKPGGHFVCWETNKSWIAEIIRRLTQHGDNFSNAHTSFSNLPALIDSFLSVESIKYQGFFAYPLLGFPDVIDFNFLGFLFNPLMVIDEMISKIPIVNKLGFAIMIRAVK